VTVERSVLGTHCEELIQMASDPRLLRLKIANEQCWEQFLIRKTLLESQLQLVERGLSITNMVRTTVQAEEFRCARRCCALQHPFLLALPLSGTSSSVSFAG
jgi:hypothetical protein